MMRTAATLADVVEQRAELSPEEEKMVHERLKHLEKMFETDREFQAKYKIEVSFGKNRSMHSHFGGLVIIWENGSKFHGGGDSKLYVCPNKKQGRPQQCEAVLPDVTTASGYAACPSCGSLWKSTELIGEVEYRLTDQNWALVLTNWMRRLGMNADLRIKYHRDDIRTATALEQERQRGGELLSKVRGADRRSSAIYPLRAIIKDTSAGADLYKRVLAFIRS